MSPSPGRRLWPRAFPRRRRDAADRGRRPLGRATWVLLPALELAALLGGATIPAGATPGFLQQELSRFASSPQAQGLTFCALFAHLTPPELPVPSSVAIPDSLFPVRDPYTIEYGVDAPLVPASLTKLATSALALERLGPYHTFHTRVLAVGTLQGGVLAGDLVVQGGGDPYLVSERLWLLAHELRAGGLTHVRGRLLLDSSRMDPPADDPARAQEREISEKPYGARLSALAVNFNAAGLRLAPAATAGAPALVTVDPFPCSYLRVVNRLVTGSAESRESWSLHLVPGHSQDSARVEGTLPLGAEPQTAFRSVSDPEAFSLSLLRAFLQQGGITIDGPDARGATPAGARLLCDFPSLPLRDLLRLMNQHSNNFMADMIAMALPETPSARLNLTAGGEALTSWLHQRFGRAAPVRLYDGSGLNPADRLTGSVLERLLYRTWKDLRLQPDFAASLPVPGEEGTLHERFRQAHDLVLRAKSGTMGDPAASGLAGYLQDAAGRPTAFVILMNAAAGSSWDIARMQALQEAWITEYLR